MASMLVDYGSSDDEGRATSPAHAAPSLSSNPPRIVAAPDVSLEDPMQLSHSLIKLTDTTLTYNMPLADLSRPLQGPANPFKPIGSSSLVYDLSSNALKRKNTLTGYAEEAAISSATFNTQQRTFTSLGYARDPSNPNAIIGNIASAALHGGKDVVEYRPSKAETEAIRAKRLKKGDPSIVDGEGAYLGPWAGYKDDEQGVVVVGEDKSREGEGTLGHEDEEEYEEEVVAPVSNPIIDKAGKEYLDVNTSGVEQTEFHGSHMYDYQGRTYMHVPQDLEVDLGKDIGSITNFIPKKLIHTWSGHIKPITALRFFPVSGHLLLSSGADSKIKLWDVYHERELLRSYSGHAKSITTIEFSPSGTDPSPGSTPSTSHGQFFLSASYDRQIKLWSTETGQCISKYSTGKIPHCLSFNPSQPNEFLAGMSDKKIIQFDIRSGKVVQEYDYHLGAINTITFVDQNRRFMTTSDDKSLRAWEYGLPVPIKFIAEPYMYPLVRAASHPSGKYVAYQSGDNQIVVYASTDKFRQNRKKSFRGHNNAGYAIDVDISPDGQFVMSGDSGGYVCFWSWRGCKMYHKMMAGGPPVGTTGGGVGASGSGGGGRNTGGGGSSSSNKGQTAGAVVACKWHPQESSKVVTAGLDGLIKFWD